MTKTVLYSVTNIAKIIASYYKKKDYILTEERLIFLLIMIQANCLSDFSQMFEENIKYQHSEFLIDGVIFNELKTVSTFQKTDIDASSQELIFGVINAFIEYDDELLLSFLKKQLYPLVDIDIIPINRLAQWAKREAF